MGPGRSDEESNSRSPVEGVQERLTRATFPAFRAAAKEKNRSPSSAGYSPHRQIPIIRLDDTLGTWWEVNPAVETSS